ncbi:hypothetical protein K457DRAFT_140851 [Linnemannia elongata AG-77]|uniref:F-box domain-containing protein n=1 Tax=Linnemannia elongata AG-77 TaxID=1314771 RepID=A0A197JL06_9FUNG|nr:hypothetical protein K457DRAFT_140851 [Linnemannia elongata AG-77]
MRRQAPVSFQDLPQEIQDMIFVLLSRHDAAVCALVCQAWFDVFAPVLLDSLVSTSPVGARTGDGCVVVAVGGGGRRKVRQEVRTVLDAYQRMTEWLLSQDQEGGQNGSDTAQQGAHDKVSANAGKSAMGGGLLQAPEPAMPVISRDAVEQVLRNSDGLQEVRVTGLWTPLITTPPVTGGAGVAFQSPSTSLDKRLRLPYPLCRMNSLRITNIGTTQTREQDKETTTLLSLLEGRSSPSPPTFNSSSPSSSPSPPPPPPIQDEVGLQLNQAAAISMMSQDPARVLGALPATLSRLVLENVEHERLTGMLAASWRTIDSDCIGSSGGGLREEMDSTQALTKRKESEWASFQSNQQQQDVRFHHIRRIHHSCLQLDKSAYISLLRRFPNLIEIHLCLSRTMKLYTKEIAETLSTSCPGLNVGVFGGQDQDLTDQELATLIGASAGGWKTLAADTHCVFGPLSAAAVVVGGLHTRTLENFRVTTGIFNFPSPMIQELLCTATRLKRFEGRSFHRDWAPMIHISAKDLVQGEWACKDLETFHCAIKDIPRPDIKTRKNGQPLVGRMHRGVSMEESLRVQRLVYEQLGRLRKLRELVLGYRSCDGDERFGGFVTDEDLGWEQGITEADYYSADSPISPVGSVSSSSINDGIDSNEGKVQDEEDEDMPTEMLYDCLAMSLESGLELLGGLRELKWLSLEGTSHCVKDVERKWMANQWPGLFLEDELEEEDDRGGSGGGGVLRDVFWKKFMICGYHATEPWYNNWEDIEANA